jgi:hypothetical protein
LLNAQLLNKDLLASFAVKNGNVASKCGGNMEIALDR